jgi:hypothetical protein
MKKSLKYITVFCLGLMLASSGALAETNERVQAAFAKFNIQINGEVQEVTALVHDGASYYPIRTLAELFDREISGYNPNTRTISIDSSNTGVFVEGNEMNAPELQSTSELEFQIIVVNNQIKSTKETIITLEEILNNPLNTDEREINQRGLDGFKRNLADLEAQKAELEAQLQPTE